ncbi:MAG: sigma-54 dependent transcriptional regulator [Magnetococcus sp. DMHC-6]
MGLDFLTFSEQMGMGERLNESIARLESLKLRILGTDALPEAEKEGMFRELDLLRGAFFELVGQHQHRLQEGVRQVDFLPMAGGRGHQDLILEGILGHSKKIVDILKIVARIAPTKLAILLEGETGTGKELLARVVHLNSGRSKFVAVNCGAFPSGLIESELFGHIKGAFTGAAADRKGKFEEADGGTIFLDEIGDLELSAQVKLLRVLEQGELQRVGSDSVHRIDVRLITATNRNLEEMVAQGTFREDLFYRINICPLTIPPLRERRDEIEILLEFFFQEMGQPHLMAEPKLDRKLKNFILHEYSFPGNIRELRNLAQYIAAIYVGETVCWQDLPQRYRRGNVEEQAGTVDNMETVREEAEREFLVRLLTEQGGKVDGVCQQMGLSRARVYQLLKKYGLRPLKFRT